MSASLARRSLAEFLGTALLLAAVVGSGIMAERLCAGNVGLALLANTLATAAMLLALILALGAISGAHFNPLVTLGEAWDRALPVRDVLAYLGAQLGGAFLGVASAHLMFGLPPFTPSTHVRAGNAQAFSEFVATFGLVLVLRCVARARPERVALGVAAYITSAYWFTASTSFANPAVTLARACTDSFAGIRPGDAPTFLIAQLIGAAAATGTFKWLHLGRTRREEERTVQTVLFACVHNAGRSQMAAALFTALCDPRRARAESAGTHPAHRVNPRVVEVLGELGLDIRAAQPRLLTPELAARADLLITLGCGEQCPLVPGVRRRDWPLADPGGLPLENVRALRDEIRARVQALVAEHGWQRRDETASV